MPNERRVKDLATLLLAVDSAIGTRSANAQATLSRRVALGAGVVSGFTAVPAFAAVAACKKEEAGRCFSSTSSGKNAVGPWTWPSDTSRDQAIADLSAVMNAYPQAGQDQGDIDGGGWSLVDDQLTSSGYARYEFKSSGKKWIAKLANGGKPFTDDVIFQFGDSKLDLRSASRLGDSDFGVNAKRLNFISAALRKKGWDAKSIQI
mmetsp:Transcript_113376/g.179173  ORF Transcript_113376/g.179173 Transcript_113376/m.179173 type:complete len:205 (+) Transcript_113376:1-615(+)